jgi:hypothetical protein
MDVGVLGLGGQFMSQELALYSAGNTPKVASVQAVAFYEPTSGQIRHMHHAITLEGAKALDAEAVKQEAIHNVKQLGTTVDGLKVLHVPEATLAGGRFRVDLKTEKLIPLELPPGIRIFKTKG